MTEKKRNSKLMLGEHLNIGNTNKLHTRLCNCAEKHVDVNVNAEKVLTIDTTALQLLLAFIQQVQVNGNVVNWQKPSDALLKTVSLTGLSTHLGLAEAK
jgi:anti-anti-sigma factor